MTRLIRLFVSALVPVFMLAGFAAQPVAAQEKAKAAKAEASKPTIKILFENDKTRVFEVTFKPGDEGGNVARPYRIVRALKGGTIQRIYPDGKTETRVWKTGEVREVGPDTPFIPKNVGKTTIVLYVVELKQAK